jgi:plastocyanin
VRNLRIVFALGAATLACSGDDGPSQPSDGNGALTVNVVNNSFDPGALSVPVNGTVTWQWNSSGVVHNVTFQDDAPDSGDLSSGSFARTFSVAGTYPYACTIHAAEGMAGTVTVSAGTGGGNGDGGGDGGGYP